MSHRRTLPSFPPSCLIIIQGLVLVLLQLMATFCVVSVEAFVVVSPSSRTRLMLISPLKQLPPPLLRQQHYMPLQATATTMTIDPTTFLNDSLAGVSGTPVLLLAVPIVTALGVASLIVWFIVSYATPAEPNEDDKEKKDSGEK